MDHQQEHAWLKHYATLTNSKILESQADLNPKDRAMPEMLSWCRRQEPIVVLKSGTILCSNPSARLVQNCKIVMQNKGLLPGNVFPASSYLIRMLLENAEEEAASEDDVAALVSSQQQRLRLLIKEALACEATDIHLEVREDLARIRFRKHGELFLHAEWLPKLAREIASVAFNKETDHAVSHFNPLIPQSASMPIEIDGMEIRLRLASLPAHQGFDVVMRLLTSPDEKISTFAELGYTPQQIQFLEQLIQRPYGAVIVAGPTGSGKTTTLASCMTLIKDSRKVYSIEDPVEKIVHGVTQIPVNTEYDDRDFASMARTVLRMDPDVMILGEVRDSETTQIMLRAALTGHLVLSTLHANTALDIVMRLEDLGASPAFLAAPDLLAGLICQRLAPLLCEYCALPLEKAAPEIKARWEKIFANNAQIKVRHPQGCKRCHGLGIYGRVVVAEMLPVDAVARHFIRERDLSGWQTYLKQQGWQSYRDQLINLVQRGACDPLDAEKLAGSFPQQQEGPRVHEDD